MCLISVAMNTTKRALIIAHEKWGTQGIARALIQAKFQIKTIGVNEKTIKRVYEAAPHIVIMADITPQEYSICSKIMDIPNLPVIMLPSGERGRSNASTLNLGADECMPSPVHSLELVARAHTLLRRYRKSHNDRINFYPEECKVEIADRTTVLSPVQFRLFTCLALNEGKLVLYDHLASGVLDKSISVNTLHFHMRRLKLKLGILNIRPYRLFQFRGEGYCFSRSSSVINNQVNVKSENTGLVDE